MDKPSVVAVLVGASITAVLGLAAALIAQRRISLRDDRGRRFEIYRRWLAVLVEFESWSAGKRIPEDPEKIEALLTSWSAVAREILVFARADTYFAANAALRIASRAARGEVAAIQILDTYVYRVMVAFRFELQPPGELTAAFHRLKGRRTVTLDFFKIERVTQAAIAAWEKQHDQDQGGQAH